MDHDATKLFLQGLMSRRCVSDRVARVLYKKCCAAAVACVPEGRAPLNDFDLVIATCSRDLGHMDFALEAVIDDYTGRKMWMIVNVKSDDFAQLATEYSAAEIAFFKQLLEEIITSPNESYSISSIHALKQVKSLKTGNKTITRAQGEVLLASFVANGWLTKSPRGRYMIGLRSRGELRDYLSNNLEDIPTCNDCGSPVFCGVRCITAECKIRLHRHCFKTTARTNCPVCRTVWAGKELRKIGDDSVGGDDDHRRVLHQQDDDDLDQDSEEEQRTRIKRKGKAQKNTTVSSEDENIDDSQMQVDQEEPEPITRRSTRRR